MDHTLNSKAHNYLLFSIKSSFQKEASITPIANHFSTLSNLDPVPNEVVMTTTLIALTWRKIIEAKQAGWY